MADALVGELGHISKLLPLRELRLTLRAPQCVRRGRHHSRGRRRDQEVRLTHLPHDDRTSLGNDRGTETV